MRLAADQCATCGHDRAVHDQQYPTGACTTCHWDFLCRCGGPSCTQFVPPLPIPQDDKCARCGHEYWAHNDARLSAACLVGRSGNSGRSCRCSGWVARTLPTQSDAQKQGGAKP